MPIQPRKPSPKKRPKARRSRSKKSFSWKRFVWGWFFKLGVLGSILGVAFYFWLFHFMPTLNPNDEYTKEHIKSKLSSETSVYYNDGKTFMGSFFANEHRRYIPYERIPEKLIQAIVAGEDGAFFEHNGFNPKGFARAMFSNLKARRFVAGGSTLTQQTAKNIFGRKGRNIMAKYNELVQALRLEHHFSKQDILEFYLNQFYVTGTGRGVGIASRYFFDKDLSELSTRQLAFIAGSVKGPHNYDPFIQSNDEKYKAAIERGRHRIEYILGRMRKENFLDENEYQKAMKAPTNFARGTFRSPLNTSMKQVLNTLNAPEFESIWIDNDIDHWQDAHLKITSTIDPEIQRGSHLALRQNLTRLALVLEKFSLPTRKTPSRAQHLTQGEAFYGEVVEETKEGLLLKSGRFRLLFPLADLEKFEKYGKNSGYEDNREIFKKGKWKKPGQILRLVSLENASTPEVKPTVLVNVLVSGEIQGATGILEHGKWISSVGGFNDKDFDRVHSAKRQLGSAWKIPLYALAMKLGWRIDDLLENKSNLFQYDDQFYYPNPDHTDRGDEVTIQWAGTKSENIASVFLLVHLLDKMNQNELISLARELKLAPESGEDSKSWYKRVRDHWGVTLNLLAAKEVLFEKARRKVEKDLSFDMNFRESEILRTYKFGRDFDKEMKVQNAKKNYSNVSLLKHNYLRDVEIYAKVASDKLNSTFAKDSLGRWGVFPQGLTPEHKKQGWTLQVNPFHELGDSATVVETIFGSLKTLLPGQVDQPELENFWIEGRLKISTLMKIKEMMEETKVDNAIEWFFENENYVYHPTLKQQMALKVFALFMQQMGVEEKIDEVPSMVLGATSIKTSEMIQVYQSITTGLQYKSMQGSGAWVSKIEDAKGNVLYDLSKDIQPVRVLEPKIVSQVNMILESIVRNGTGRRADRAIKVKDPKLDLEYNWPVGGKTGTTNGYRNAAFIGNISGWDKSKKSLSFEKGAIIGSYVGFDKNRAMRRGGVRIGGSNGALPMWNQAALEIIDHHEWRHHVDYLDLEIQITNRLPVDWGMKVSEIPVDKMTGTMSEESTGSWVHWPSEYVEE